MNTMFVNKKSIVISGPEGSGKSTLARLIAGSSGQFTQVTAHSLINDRFALGDAGQFETVLVEEATMESLTVIKSIMCAGSMHVHSRAKAPRNITTPNFVVVMAHGETLNLDLVERRFTSININN